MPGYAVVTPQKRGHWLIMLEQTMPMNVNGIDSIVDWFLVLTVSEKDNCGYRKNKDMENIITKFKKKLYLKKNKCYKF